MALVSLYCEEAMRKDKQFKVKGCRIARPRGRDVKRRSASMRLRVFFSGTPALINMERSGMLVNEWLCRASEAREDSYVTSNSSKYYFSKVHFSTAFSVSFMLNLTKYCPLDTCLLLLSIPSQWKL